MNIKRTIIQWIPDIGWDYYRRFKYHNTNRKEQKEKVDTVFNRIYQFNLWQSKDSASGTGSDLVQTVEIRAQIPELLRRYQLKSMLDIPCGDFNWMKLVDLGPVEYTGGDIVADLIDHNTQRFGSTTVSFRKLNLLEDPLPKVDLLFCRDCLVHFSYAHIQQAIQNIKKSGSTYLLTTSFFKRRLNFDISTGDWRPINLQLKPFSFPSPEAVIIEKCTEGNGKSYDKALLLFRVSELPDFVIAK